MTFTVLSSDGHAWCTKTACKERRRAPNASDRPDGNPEPGSRRSEKRRHATERYDEPQSNTTRIMVLMVHRSRRSSVVVTSIPCSIRSDARAVPTRVHDACSSLQCWAAGEDGGTGAGSRRARGGRDAWPCGPASGDRTAAHPPHPGTARPAPPSRSPAPGVRVSARDRGPTTPSRSEREGGIQSPVAGRFFTDETHGAL